MDDHNSRSKKDSGISMFAEFESDESSLFNTTIDPELPILALRDNFVFPGAILPITIGRPKSLKLLKYCVEHKSLMGALTQKDSAVEDPMPEDFYPIGVVLKVLRLLELPDGKYTAIMQGIKRFHADRFERVNRNHPWKAKITVLEEEDIKNRSREMNTLVDSCKDIANQAMTEMGDVKNELEFALKNISSNFYFIEFCCTNVPFSMESKYKLLKLNNLMERGYLLLRLMNESLQYIRLRNEIQQKAQEELNEQQKEYFLQQEIRKIQDELGNSSDAEIAAMREQASKKNWNKETCDTFLKEVDKLERIFPQNPDYNVQYNFLQTILNLPWGYCTEDNLDIDHAERILNRDHYGMEKVKERILEHLAVVRMRADFKSPILCLYGPPGVGKTSLGKSIAESLGRKYVRVSLGGLHDESEIRGHRRTYIGAMPGRIIKNIQKAGTSNPVFVLDEIDKISHETLQGDPSSALLEVLDPEQNSTFHDNYLDMDYDLSKVMFIATANDVSAIPSALKDRMELIEVPGYITEEKIEIARRHLLPKAKKDVGIKTTYEDIKIGKATLEKIIEDYTRESGVRQLDKMLNKLIRKEAYQYAMHGAFSPSTVKPSDIPALLGTPIFSRDKYQGNDYAGVVTGLAWTAVGGEILFIEASLSRSKAPKLSLTGSLGDVMKESAVLALEYIKAHAAQYGIDYNIFDHWNIHIHVPDGATPKDGPSAGVTMTTALISALTQRKVRKNLAMTGEITLRGKVTPVGGIREKILAAKRAGIKEIILCAENERHIQEIPAAYLEGLEFHYVTDIREVIAYALLEEKVKNPVDFTLPETEKEEKK